MKKQTAVAMQIKKSEGEEHTRRSVDGGTLNTLFKLIEETEPTLLLCRDALAADGDHRLELKTIKAALARIRVLKSNFLGSPALTENS